MTLNIAKIKQGAYRAMALGAAISLAACSSTPSPWTQQESPWENKAAKETAAMEEGSPVVEDQSPFVEEAAFKQSSYEDPVEPPVMQEPQAMMGDILSQPENYFTVQLVASSSMKNLKLFTRQNQLSEDWIAETSVSGKTWYVLLLGVYPTMEQARGALANMNANLGTRPWVRSIGSLQAVVVR